MDKAHTENGDRYDGVTIGFHWLTALLVVVLFGTAWAWNNAPRTLHLRQPLETLHVSLGIAFAAVIVARLAWRLVGRRRLPGIEPGIAGLLSRAVHGGLYLLLAVQVALGFGLRWLQGEAFAFFGLFTMPPLMSPDRRLAHMLEDLHNLAGWTIVIVAGGHAAAALVHHFVRRDAVLGRMLPLPGRGRAGRPRAMDAATPTP